VVEVVVGMVEAAEVVADQVVEVVPEVVADLAEAVPVVVVVVVLVGGTEKVVLEAVSAEEISVQLKL
jgi:hypothetical protein